MEKTDKELAVDLVKAIVAANPRTKIQVAANQEKGVPSLTAKEIDDLLRHYYALISNLGKDT